MKRKQPTKSTSTFANPEMQQIEQLFQFMTEHNLEEFEYSRGDLHIRLRKPPSGLVLAQPRASAAPEIIVANPGGGAPAAEEASSGSSAVPEARHTEDLHLVKSPIVGTFYGSPSPGAEPFVKVGAFVETGQTLCIVEAMKLMNEIESDETGEVVRVFVENGQPVEYGQPLFGIRPSRKK
ncbi:MAG TPA: acetyl-CoA carboxylase biotin carboxyl carrier protein [Candidatus Dormibacteraeota bacterium]|nr:acetyl-CoA carboxylase biotin carboxyl carrier protein [Candidatus Dormibacteraeota bacterium]